MYQQRILGKSSKTISLAAAYFPSYLLSTLRTWATIYWLHR